MYDVIIEGSVKRVFVLCCIISTSVCIFAALLKFPYYVQLLVWGMNIFGIIILWNSFNFKIEVRQDNIVFHEYFGRKKEYTFHEMNYYILRDTKVQVYGDGKKLFWFSSMYINGDKLLKKLTEIGIEKKG